ncbi:hypothetical protein T552_03435 [Pneumocystis carinii B80]|uniref:U3 small nucleolar RNA-associated protein 14 n=1 Tax=Pneumocystis carinii (strain B80) TaxID=1408658 RepID=A0A0W4ZB12_PNEC8|nr:hypothetical protein T552_03435 [Pneumocystis carinii B80]KTW25575.1 hypothetical protein T552_03435 [Pneumocystis carinii B80]
MHDLISDSNSISFLNVTNFEVSERKDQDINRNYELSKKNSYLFSKFETRRFKRIKNVENIKFRKKKFSNLNFDKNIYNMSPDICQDSESLLSDAEIGIIENENTCYISEIFNNEQASFNNNGCYGNLINEDLEPNCLEEFIETLERKQKHNSFLKINEFPEKSSCETLSNQEKNNESNYFDVSKKLSFSEMIAPLNANITASSYLRSFSQSDISKFSDNSLNAPLAKPIQDLFDRQAAYDIVKKDLKKWEDVVKINRKSEFLKFPIDSLEKPKLTNNSLFAKFQVSTHFERSIDDVLQSSGLKDERSALEFEELFLNKLPVEEVAVRRAELRLIRDLMFRHERKAKRISKIKSKLYRKIHRHEKKKKSLALSKIDYDGLPFQNEINKTKKGIDLYGFDSNKLDKQQLNNNCSVIGNKQFIVKQLQHDKRLQKRIRGICSSDSDEGLDNDNKSPDISNKDLLTNLMKFRNENIKLKSSMGMQQFMNSEKDKKIKDEGTINEVLNIKKDSEVLCSEYNSNKVYEDFSNSIGRRIFNPSFNKDYVSNINDQKSVETFNIDKSWDFISKNSSGSSSASKILDTCFKNYNPWLVATDELSPEFYGLGFKFDSENFKETNETELCIDISQGLLFPTSEIEGKNYRNDTEEHLNMIYNGSRFALKQKDLVARAFSGDNVVEKFQEKFKNVEEYEPYKKNDIMPGWGSWCGFGIKHVPKKNKVSDISKKDRKDLELKNVIISDKNIKKSKKLLVSSVPYPYKTKEQYEKSLMLPLGLEWTTRRQYQKLITPRIIIKQGSVIEPLKIS